MIGSFVLGKTCLTENIALQQNVPVIHAEVLMELIPFFFWIVALIYYSMLWCCDYVLSLFMNGW